VGLTIAIYSSRERLSDGPYVAVVILDNVLYVLSPFLATRRVCSFYVSWESIYTPRTLILGKTCISWSLI
jgi:hypothetical protein